MRQKDEPIADWERECAENQGSFRAGLLDEAKHLVTGDRNNSYGSPIQDFTRTAAAWNAYGYQGPGGRKLTASDVALLMIMLKASRLMWNKDKQDSWTDIAGYSACGWEASQLE